jgi:hypothetical protein
MRLLLLGSVLLMSALGSCSISCGTAALHAQAAPLEFDVASVKPALPTRSVLESVRRPPLGQWRYFGITLFNVILESYPEFRLPGLVVGGPDWVKETRF